MSQRSSPASGQTTVARIAKTVWPPPLGLSLTAYDTQDKVLFVLPYRGMLPASRWLVRPVSSTERARVLREAQSLD